MESKCKVCWAPAKLKADGDTPDGKYFREYECEKGHEVVIRIKKRKVIEHEEAAQE